MLFAPILFADRLLQLAAGPFAAVLAWALASAVLSMAIYARLAPQQRIAKLKQQQKILRQDMLAYDGPWDGLCELIQKNLVTSLTLIGISLGPVVAASLPIAWVMGGLYERYPETQVFIPFGPSWMQGFDMLYLSVLITCSLIIKIRFRVI